ncbi:MAG: hypothetical protein VB128_16060 [Sedimentibacter saalensis]|uniref:hypothetical protein n=1 Tax=Sedimentibacter saalensis TaxID=130788 RepID=UPI002B1ECD38|nr:hypothetical protein [Sedimentibacter saalensis]MEA5096467.1 hypothetical protein [Sedimentibacter saalensis]
MINKVNKILKKYDVELKIGGRYYVKLVSTKDIKRITKLDNRILINKMAPTIYDVVYSREELYSDIAIIVKDNRVDMSLTCVYIPLDIGEERFNHTVGLFAFYEYPSLVERQTVRDRDYLYLYWQL